MPCVRRLPRVICETHFIDGDSPEGMSCAGIASLNRESLPFRDPGSDEMQGGKMGIHGKPNQTNMKKHMVPSTTLPVTSCAALKTEDEDRIRQHCFFLTRAEIIVESYEFY